ncbi:MAG: MnmA/TRMU family protein, partial [Phycisphaerales bacterium]
MPQAAHAENNHKTRVLLAMSGGVDSSVAAALLQRAGYEVVGVFMRLGSPGESLDELRPHDGAPAGGAVACDPAKIKIGHQGCCSINDAADAREVADLLNIPLYVVNFKKDFARIIDYFVDEYAAGRTPNPCVRCNDWLKFGKLHEYARQIGAQFVASGHYARVENPETQRMLAEWQRQGITPDHPPSPTPQTVHPRAPISSPPLRPSVALCGESPSHPSPTPALLRGIDHAKDQSYVLFGAPRQRLEHMLLPVGHFTKPTIRRIAEQLKLPVFDKPDSQEICFVPDNDYAALVERRRPELRRAGQLRDPDGNTIGQHEGQHRFTIGQRRGVGVALGYPIYVVDKDPATNTVTVGPREHLAITAARIAEANWLDTPPPPHADWIPAIVRYRAHSEDVHAHLRVLPPLAPPNS